nr:hypothetical protein [Prevotella sp.]
MIETTKKIAENLQAISKLLNAPAMQPFSKAVPSRTTTWRGL